MMITKPIIKNNIWIDKLYYIFFPSAFKFLLRVVKLSLFLFCFSASIKIQSNSKILIESFSVAFSEELTIKKAQIAKAVRRIIGEKSAGTGFFISNNTIITNAHVVWNVKDIEKITIIQEGNPRRLKVNKIVRLSIRYDLALLEVDGVVSDFLSLPEAPLKSSNVYALGYPKGQFKQIRQTSDFDLKKDYFFSDNSNTSGASGSPVLNEAHQLVGVLYGGIHNYTSFIDVKTLKSFIKDKDFLCEGTIQESVKSLRQSFEKNPQEVKNGKDSYNIYEHLNDEGDLPRAIKWLEQAAQQSYPQAQYVLALRYANAKGVEQDIPRAIELYETAAQQGYALAQHDLAEIYYNGKGVEQNIPLAIKWYETAAKQGYVLAQFNLGWMYSKGEGVEQNIPRAIELYETAAKQGYVLAQYKLALMYYKGEGVEQNIPLAIKWYETAAKQGYVLAQFNLGWMYSKGEGVEQNIPLAIKWYETAAEQGHAKAQYNLALMYYKGEGVKKDILRAIELYETAAKQGYVLAQYNLALMYYKGEGVKKDILRAIELWEKAAKQGYAPAKKSLDKILKNIPSSKTCSNIF